MADTRPQVAAEDWVRQSWLPQRFGQPFRRERLKLTSGGVFDFDAVSQDNGIVVSISTSAPMTSGGKAGVGKLQKIRADMLFLMLVRARQKFVVLTEPDMHEACLREVEAGRAPSEIGFLHAELPAELRQRVADARRAASIEVQPHRGREERAG